MKRLVLTSALLLAAFACSSEDTLGRGKAESHSSLELCTTSSGGTGGVGGVRGTVTPGLVGTWTGYLAGTPAVVKSNAVTLVLGNGSPVGSVVVGEGMPPPPPTDPDLGYPADFPLGGGGATGTQIYEGFAYSLLSGDLSDPHVQLSGSTYELWKQWCPMQTSYARGSATCGCLPNLGFALSPPCRLIDGFSGDSWPVDCGKAELCMMTKPCECSSNGCAASFVPNISLDLHHQGDQLIGTLAGTFANAEGAWSGTWSVSLARQ